MGYLKYIFENMCFNAHYISFYDADISLFDSCSWKSYKENKM